MASCCGRSRPPREEGAAAVPALPAGPNAPTGDLVPLPGGPCSCAARKADTPGSSTGDTGLRVAAA